MVFLVEEERVVNNKVITINYENLEDEVCKVDEIEDIEDIEIINNFNVLEDGNDNNKVNDMIKVN